MRVTMWRGVGLAAILWSTSAAPGHAALTRSQIACINAVTKVQAGQCELATKCINKCVNPNPVAGGVRVAARPLGSVSECQPPYTGSRGVDQCMAGTRAKAVRVEQAKCAREACPPCMAKDCREDAPVRTAATAALIDYYIPIVFCDDSRSADGLTAKELKCMRVAGVKTGRMARGLVKCYGQCSARALKAKRSVSTCLVPTSDQATQACLEKVQAKAAAAIDAACRDAPECLGAEMSRGAFWVDAGRRIVDGYQLGPQCGSPSGAFLD